MDNIERTLRGINGVYYIIYMLTILSAVGVFMMTYLNVDRTFINPFSSEGRTLYTLLILYLLISIPSAFWMFYRSLKKNQTVEDKFEKLSAYKKAAIIRLWIIGVGLIAGITLYFFMNSLNVIYCAVISAVALFLCKPTTNRIIKDLKLEDEEL